MCPRKWRKTVLKMTLEDLGELARVSTSYLSRVERGLEEPSGKVLRFYHKLSGGEVTPSDFRTKEKK